MLCLEIRVGEACTAVIPRRVAMKIETMEIVGSRTQDIHKWVEDEFYVISTSDFIDHA